MTLNLNMSFCLCCFITKIYNQQSVKLVQFFLRMHDKHNKLNFNHTHCICSMYNQLGVYHFFLKFLISCTIIIMMISIEEALKLKMERINLVVTSTRSSTLVTSTVMVANSNETSGLMIALQIVALCVLLLILIILSFCIYLYRRPLISNMNRQATRNETDIDTRSVQEQ